MSLSVVVPNNDDGEYFLVLLKRDDFIMGYQAVEGFVCPKHAFKVMLEQEVRSDVIMVKAADFYHCYTCGLIPWESGVRGGPWRGTCHTKGFGKYRLFKPVKS